MSITSRNAADLGAILHLDSLYDDKVSTAHVAAHVLDALNVVCAVFIDVTHDTHGAS